MHFQIWYTVQTIPHPQQFGVAYADKANVRMRKKYYRMISHEKKKNVAVTAVARELSCFIWGMMTDNITEGA